MADEKLGPLEEFAREYVLRLWEATQFCSTPEGIVNKGWPIIERAILAAIEATREQFADEFAEELNLELSMTPVRLADIARRMKEQLK